MPSRVDAVGGNFAVHLRPKNSMPSGRCPSGPTAKQSDAGSVSFRARPVGLMRLRPAPQWKRDDAPHVQRSGPPAGGRRWGPGRTTEPPGRKARMVCPAVAGPGEPMILRKHPMPSGGPVGMERLARATAPLSRCCAWAPACGKPTDLRIHPMSSGAVGERERSAARLLAVPGRCLRPAFHPHPPKPMSGPAARANLSTMSKTNRASGPTDASANPVQMPPT